MTQNEREFEFPYADGGQYTSIELNHEILSNDDFDPDDWAVYVLKEGADLATVLWENLPGAVSDAMLMTLLELKASTLRTRHGTPRHSDGDTATEKS